MPGPVKSVGANGYSGADGMKPPVGGHAGERRGAGSGFGASWRKKNSGEPAEVLPSPPVFPVMAEPVLMALVAEGKQAVYVDALASYYSAYKSYLAVTENVLSGGGGGKFPAQGFGKQSRVDVETVRPAVAPVPEEDSVGWLRSVVDVDVKDYATERTVASYDGGCYLHVIRRGYVAEVYARLGVEPTIEALLGLPSAAFIHERAMALRVCTMVEGRLHLDIGLEGPNFLDVLAEYGTVAKLPSWAVGLVRGRFPVSTLGLRAGVKVGSKRTVGVPGLEAAMAAVPADMKYAAEVFHKEAAIYQAQRAAARSAAGEVSGFPVAAVEAPAERAVVGDPGKPSGSTGLAVESGAVVEGSTGPPSLVGCPGDSPFGFVGYEGDFAAYDGVDQATDSECGMQAYFGVHLDYKCLFREVALEYVVPSLGLLPALSTIFAFPAHYYGDLEEVRFVVRGGRAVFGTEGVPVFVLMRALLDECRDLRTYPVLEKVKSRRVGLRELGLK